MAVYTKLTDSDIAEFLSHYAIGSLVSAKGIAEGVENTNYLLEVSASPIEPTGEGTKKCILTLFEQRTKIEDLPYFTTLMQWFSARGIPCPLPIARKDGRALGVLAGKPALIVSFLEGSGVRAIRQEHMQPLGKLIAQMHLTGMDFPHRRENALSLPGWEILVAKIEKRIDEIDPMLYDLIHHELRFLSEHWPSGLPTGPIHADLFPDNVFFQRERGAWALSGVIDFYFSCHDFWAYDLAIVINAWCFDERHKFVKERTDALMYAYTDARSLTHEEEDSLAILLRGAALRFLLTRAHDWLYTPQDALVSKKDPMEYAIKLQFHQKQMS